MSSESRFWDRIAGRYARRPVADEASYQKKLALTRDYLHPDMEVLEFGCGTGSTAIVHAPHVKHIQAIDISAAMLAIARRKTEAAGIANITFQQAGIETFRAPDASYDAVLGLSILHLLADRDAAIAKVHRLLKPGGVFVSSTTCLGETMKLLKYIGPIGRLLGLMPRVAVFTPDELRASITGAGFAIEHDWQPGRGKAVFIVARKAG
ncbi:class I SAM-dependent methyltransferase [Bauldia litoralis]|uniref:Ubiquinone/menaquinone biosynthesis C-methylase UbiE n=1 Tax=Bauldia litoralis TaxID=665467 RepID=A0A1G6BLF7_9HYPH|nr:class I SAM-dependent methyltransferase [Bauldia litoralis]SDB21459.1 Ubiquinone/menaquinone biosynthesis C-methylase UbiE [Bauldia litoralis]